MHEAVESDIDLKCRIYDLRHTFATRFALRGGSLPVLAKILGHADLSMLNRYIHPSQADMDKAMDAFSNTFPKPAELAEMLIEYEES